MSGREYTCGRDLKMPFYSPTILVLVDFQRMQNKDHTKQLPVMQLASASTASSNPDNTFRAATRFRLPNIGRYFLPPSLPRAFCSIARALANRSGLSRFK